MKRAFYFTVLFLSFNLFYAIGQTSPFRTENSSDKAKQPASLALPFLEDWTSGSLETNNWTTECENWTINYQQGNERPSVEFTWDPWFQNEYSCSLTSDVFNGDLMEVGQVFLEYDVRLDNRQATGNEKLLVEVFDGTEWHTVAEYVNDASFEWQSNSIDITDFALGYTFQIRFKATGQNSFSIFSWFVDNIAVYRICEAPENLESRQVFDTYDSARIELSWTPPPSTIMPVTFSLHWDNGSHSSGIGITNGGNFSVAAKWTSVQLAEYGGDTIERIKVFLNDDGFSEIVIKIWRGDQANNLVYQSVLNNPETGKWNSHELDTLLIIDPDSTLFVGYEVVGQLPGYNPAGTDNGPAISGYGDLIYTESGGWDSISALGINKNFSIRMILLNSDTVSKPCTGFNIYRMIVLFEEDYSLYDFIPFKSQISTYYYNDTVLNLPCYKVAAVWSSGGDTCVSDFALDIPQENDYTCTYIWEGINQIENTQISLFPIPTNNILNISSKNGVTIEEIIIYNLTGQKVFEGKPENNSIDISHLHAGLYVVEVITGEQRLKKKLVVK